MLTEAELHQLGRDLLRGERAAAAVGLAQQRALAAEQARAQWAWGDGLGRKVASIHPEVFHRMRRQHGADIWQDDDFVRGVLRDNPQLRVPTHSPQIRVFVDGFGASRGDASRKGVAA